MKNSPFQAMLRFLPALLLIAGCNTPSSDFSDSFDYFADAELETVLTDTRSVDPEPTPILETTPAQDPVPQDPVGFQEGRDAASLHQQKVAILVQADLDTAMAAMADGRLVEAESSVLSALERSPGDRNAMMMLDQIQMAMGKAIVPISGSMDDVHARLQARLHKEKAATEAHAARGVSLLQKGELDEAIAALILAKARIDGIQYEMDWEGLDAQVESALQQAKDQRATALATSRDNEKKEAFEMLQAEEEKLRIQEEHRKALMLSTAIEAFDSRDFDQALTLSEDVLAADPLNEQARELRDATLRARHELVNEEFVAQRSERFKSWLQDMEDAMIPSTEVLDMPDLDYWARITNARSESKGESTDTAAEMENLALQNEVANSSIPGFMVEGETSLEEVIGKLRPYTDIPFVVTPDAIDAVDSEGIEFNLNLNRPMTVENALLVITNAAGPDVTYTYKHGVVYITSVSQAQGQFVLRAHDVQDLTSTLVDFSGPKINQIHLPDNDDDSEELVQGGIIGEPTPILDPANLETLVQQSVAAKTWDDLEGVSITYSNGHLIVWHTPEVQNEIDIFLEDLRRYISSMVTIEARFLTVQKDFLQEVGLDFRGLGGTFSPPTDMPNLDDFTSGLEDNTSLGLDNDGQGLPGSAETNPSAGAFFNEGGDGDIRGRTENILGDYGSRLTNTGGMAMQFVFLDDTQLSMVLRAVEKSNRAEEVNAVTVSAQNTQRSFITVLNQITYVQDMDVEVAQASIIADPMVGVVSDGMVLDVRPTISHDRRYITLELQPTVASLKRPIPEFTSSLAGLTTPVTLQLPELTVSSANTTAVVPDGGTVVIAGLKKVVDVEQRAEVPIMAKFPVLSWLFKSEGEANEKEDVIIIIRAQITDALEIADKLDTRV
ncbi:MAG: hypothetical protein QGH51_09205 [Planctomycetota bacterium]|nr:hypothetical protein [Planctomycetota bacterium]